MKKVNGWADAGVLLLVEAAFGADIDPAGVKSFNAEAVAWKTSGSVKQENGGFGFVSSTNGWAAAPWDVGNGPFALTWDVQINKGTAQAWRYPGVAVGLSSASPETMTSQDLSLVFGLHLDGVSASVRKGRLYEPNRNDSGWPPKYSNLEDEDITGRYDLNQHGAGGRWYSRTWPNEDLDGTRLAFRIARTATNTLQFAAYHADYEDGREPWWSGTWVIPEKVASIPLLFVVMKTMISPADYLKPDQRPEGGLMMGRIENVAGQAGATAEHLLGGIKPAPVPPGTRLIERIEPRETLPKGGEVVTLIGAGFDSRTVVSFNGHPAEIVGDPAVDRMSVRVPDGEPGPVVVTARSGDAVFEGAPGFGYAPHPYLYYKANDLTVLRKRFKEPMFSGYRDLILQNAAEVPSSGVETEKSGKGGIIDLFWAYVLSGDDQFKKRLLVVLEDEARSLEHEQFRMMAAHDMAVAYDGLFEELPLPLRLKMERYLERAARVYVRNVRRRAWWYAQNISNTIAVGGAGGGGAGLALMNSTPVAREAVELVRPTVREWYRAIAADGGCIEGTLYWNYGLTAYLRLGHMLKNATGDDAGLLDTPALRNNVRFVETQLGGDGRFLTFNDTQPWLTGLAVCSDFGNRFNQPLMLWMADYMAGIHATESSRPSEVSRGDVVAYAFLWRGNQSAPVSFPGVPVAAKLDVMHWGVLRSDSSFKPNLVAGIKGQGGAVSHHVQDDAGSLVVQSRGEAFLIDPGYYQPDAVSHSLPLINGKGPVSDKEMTRDAPLLNLHTNGAIRSMTVDFAGHYRQEGVKRARRHVVMVADRALVVLDDLAVSGIVTSRFQCGFGAQVDRDGQGAVIAGKESSLSVRMFGPMILLTCDGPKDFGKSWVFRRLADQGEVQWHALSAEYQCDSRRPLVTVLTPVPKNGKREDVSVMVEPGLVRIALAGGPVVDFVNQSDGWNLVK